MGGPHCSMPRSIYQQQMDDIAIIYPSFANRSVQSFILIRAQNTSFRNREVNRMVNVLRRKIHTPNLVSRVDSNRYRLTLRTSDFSMSHVVGLVRITGIRWNRNRTVRPDFWNCKCGMARFDVIYEMDLNHQTQTIVHFQGNVEMDPQANNCA